MCWTCFIAAYQPSGWPPSVTHAAEENGKSLWIIQEGCVKHGQNPTPTYWGNVFNCCHILKDFQSINLTLVYPVSIPPFVLNAMTVQKVIYLIIVSLCMFLCHRYGGDRAFGYAESTTLGSSEPRGVQVKAGRGGEKWW